MSSNDFCVLCKAPLNGTPLSSHITVPSHLLRHRYNIRKLNVRNVNLLAEICCGCGNDSETVLFNAGLPLTVELKIHTYNSHDSFIVTQLVLLERNENIKVASGETPSLLISPTKNAAVKIHINLKKSIREQCVLILEAFDNVRHQHFHIIKRVVFDPIKFYFDTSGTIIGKTTGGLEVFKNELEKYENLIKNSFHVVSGMTRNEWKFLLQVRKTISSITQLTTKNYGPAMKILLSFEYVARVQRMHSYDKKGQKITKYLHPSKTSCYELKVEPARKRIATLNGRVVVAQEQSLTVKFQGVIVEIQENAAIIEFPESFARIAKNNVRFCVAFIENELPFCNQLRAIREITEARLEHIFFPPETTWTVGPQKNLQWFNKYVESNNEQKQAVQCILKQTSYPYPYILFGPPGTGKTTTIVEATMQIIKVCSAKVLVAVPSNKVADEISLKLLRFTKNYYRIVSACYDPVKIPNKIKPYCNIEKNKVVEISGAKVASCDTVICTVSSCFKLVKCLAIQPGHFGYVIIDESSQCTEAEILAVVGKLFINSANKNILGQVVLCGDPWQLGPVLISTIASSFGYDISTLERLSKTSTYAKDPKLGYNPNMVTKLVQNYRSAKNLLTVPNELFYDNELVACRKTIPQLEGNVDFVPNIKYPALFQCIQGPECQNMSSGSYNNDTEADVVVNYLKKLFDCKLGGIEITAKDIGIITPYSEQAALIERKIIGTKYQKVQIGVVEVFQGSEKNIIILSTVRSTALGFLRNERRFNVAMTRARDFLIVLGNKQVLSQHRCWKTFIDLCKKNGAVKS